MTTPTAADYARADALHATTCQHGYRSWVSCRECKAAAFAACAAEYEQKLTDERRAAFDMCNAHRATVLALEANLAAAERHADELAKACERLRIAVGNGKPHSDWVSACEVLIDAPAAHAALDAPKVPTLREAVAKLIAAANVSDLNDALGTVRAAYEREEGGAK